MAFPASVLLQLSRQPQNEAQNWILGIVANGLFSAVHRKTLLWLFHRGRNKMTDMFSRHLQIHSLIHDDVIKWKHFPRNWPFVQGIHRSSVNSPHKGQWREALMLSLICVWINDWVNNREAGDLGRYRAHYDVFVMYKSLYFQTNFVESCLECLVAKVSPAIQIMSWWQTDDRPLSQELLTLIIDAYICITQPRWFKINWSVYEHIVQ